MTKVALSPRAAVARGALMFYLKPRLAQDQWVDFGPILRGVTRKNFAAKQAGIAAALREAVRGKLASDADVDDVEDILAAVKDFKDEVVEEAEELAEEVDPAAAVDPDVEVDPDAPPVDPDDEEVNKDSPEMLAKVLEFLQGKLSPEDMNALTEMVGEEGAITESPEDKAAREEQDAADARAALGRDETEEERMKRLEANDSALVKRARAGLVTKTAMDEAIRREVDKTRVAMTEQARAVQEATRVIRPYVGELAQDAALDTAEKIYAKALKVLGVAKVEAIHPSAYRTILEMQPRATSARQRLAADAAPATGVKSFAERFPNAVRIGSV